jgi:DNA-binding NtrC family response regulator
VRIIAATNKDLVGQVEKGLFREDLYYRINVLPVALPSLRERSACILPLAELLLKKCCISMHRDIQGFTENTRNLIQDYHWPGNIRQLANTIERAVILEDDCKVHSCNLALPERIARSPREITVPPKLGEDTVRSSELTESLAEQEKELILRVLEECLWVQKNAATKLGISPRALNYKINKMQITHPHWRRNKVTG